ncbi:hypothetical protein PR202_ga30913 [Eleusine coracana subsp. coracana]|uniref:At1g61320/AtMIF1 LRR domain-containing protein n=1 Tax=Eleusine coracana subsp. coracana TaxID=191504 RepID=A0AAV5DQ79_ELECO|nr:hypothetical protein PR202_ga30913 [Eleusine coracana subsp. coracana]
MAVRAKVRSVELPVVTRWPSGSRRRKSRPHKVLPVDRRDGAAAAQLVRRRLQWIASSFQSRQRRNEIRYQTFLRYGRQYIGLDETESGRDLSHKVVCIIRNHSGVGLKIFKVDYMYADDFNDFDASPYLDLDRWLLVVVKPRDELELLIFNYLPSEQLHLTNCMEIICLKISYILQQLSYLHVSECQRLTVSGQYTNAAYQIPLPQAPEY